LVLLAIAGAKLNAPERFIGRFLDWGLEPGLIQVTGMIELLLGTGLLVSATRSYAAASLSVWMLGVAVIHISSGDATLLVLPLATAGAAVIVLWSGLRSGLHGEQGLPAPLAAPPRGALRRVLFLFRLLCVSFFFRWIVGGIAYWAALPLLGALHARATGRQGSRRLLESVLLYLLVLGVGVAGVWGFVGHFFMSDQVASSIGWTTGSPFQLELAFYHLASGLVGLHCLWIRDRYWIAAGSIPALFALGAGMIHVQDFLASGNAAPGNWGPSVLVGNFLIPLVLLVCLAWFHRMGGFQVEFPRSRGH
jgi:hypothetical protein